MIQENEKREALTRLKKVEGQVRGLFKMVEEERYCMEILQQTSAIHEALRGVEKLVMKGYIETCVTDAIRKGNNAGKIYAELMDAIYKFAK